MTRVRWYVNRLRAMSVPEAGYRLGQRLRMWTERAGLALHPEGLGSDALWKGLGQSGPPNWDAWPRAVAARSAHSGDAPQQFIDRYPDECAALIARADAVCAGRVRFFGHLDVQLADPPDWHRDPVTGRRWPRDAFYGDVGTRWGGAKTIWEAARHQHLITLAQAYWLTADRRYSTALQRQLESWCEQNAALRGVHWTSGLEVGVRLLSWWWICALVRPDTFPASLWRAWTREIVLCGRYLAQHFSAYSSANNHLIGEAAGLLAAAFLLPEWEEAPRWRERALATLEREVERQILPDGAPAEQAAHYHGFVIDFYLWCAKLVHLGLVRASPLVAARLAKAGDFLTGLMDCSGCLPDFGDSDGGYAYALTADDSGLTRSRLASLAVICARGDFKQAAGTFDARSWWLLGEAGARAFEELPAAGVTRTSRFDVGGYWVLRGDGAHTDERCLVFDCGPLGYLSLAAHGHADCLSVWLSVGGRALLVDTGTYRYHEEPEWRAYFRGTAGHNTVRVDGSDQSEATGPTMWGQRARPTLITHHSTTALDWVEGEHDGYTRLPSAVIHRRAVGFVRPEYFVILDWLLGTGRHSVEQFFHFPAGAMARIADGNCVLQADELRATLLLRGCDDAVIRVMSGETEPIHGWLSPRFAAKVFSPTLLRQWTGDCPAVMVTVIWLGADDPPVWESSAVTPAVLEFALQAANWRDEFSVGLHGGARLPETRTGVSPKRIRYTRTVAGVVTGAVSLD